MEHPVVPLVRMVLLNHVIVDITALLAVPYQVLGVIQVILHVVGFQQMKRMKKLLRAN